jgi:hypothetical protein
MAVKPNKTKQATITKAAIHELTGKGTNTSPSFFFRPTPSWLPPGRLTRYMTLQKQ